MPRTALRRIAAVLTVAIVVLGGIALPAAAAKGGSGRGHKVERTEIRGKSSTKGQIRGKSVTKRQHGRKAKVRPVKFAAAGYVTAVGTDTLTVAVKGGTKNVRGLADPFFVSETAKINRNDEAAELADLQVGDHVAVKGTYAEGVFTASKINAEGEEVVADPILDEPVVEEPVAEDPVVEDPIVEDPVVEDPVVEDPIVDEPVEEPAV